MKSPKGDQKHYCRNKYCNVELREGVNWNCGDAERGNYICKVCQREYMRRWRKERLERIMKEWT